MASKATDPTAELRGVVSFDLRKRKYKLASRPFLCLVACAFKMFKAQLFEFRFSTAAPKK